MESIDFKKDPTYKAKLTPEIVTIPAMMFVMVDGEGAPDADESASTNFQAAMQIIYGIVYGIKFWDKKHPAPAGYAKFTMPPIEAQWWTKSGQTFDLNNPDDWVWTAMHRLPEFVTPAYFAEVVNELVAKKKTDIFRKAKLKQFDEGLSVHIMHHGPYDEEQPTIETMHAFAKEQGYGLVGKHHELYFTDPRRTAPEKMRTILRQPVKKEDA